MPDTGTVQFLLTAAGVSVGMLAAAGALPGFRSRPTQPPRIQLPPARPVAALPSAMETERIHLAQDHDWHALIQRGDLPVLDTCEDPGNAGQRLYLVTDTYGLLGNGVRARFLIVTNGTPAADGHRMQRALAVAPTATSALDAAAWTYGDDSHPVQATASTYALLDTRS